MVKNEEAGRDMGHSSPYISEKNLLVFVAS
jgi:hypothetical protein